MNYESKSRAQLIEEIERLREKTAVFEALQVEGEPIQSPQRVDKKYSEPKAGDDSSSTDRIRVSGINIEWDPVKGVCTFENLPVAMMWIDTTLSGLMSGVQSMVGTKRFNLALQMEELPQSPSGKILKRVLKQ